MSILFWIGYGDTYMPLLTILLYMFLWKRIQYREFVILLYSIFCFILFGITNVLVLKKINNLAFYHFFSLGELMIVSHYFLKLIFKKFFFFLFFIFYYFYYKFYFLIYYKK